MPELKYVIVDYNSLTHEEKVWIAYQTLLDYFEDYICCKGLFDEYKSNKIFRVVLELLSDINIYNRRVRHIDWKHPKRYDGTLISIIKKIKRKYASIIETGGNNVWHMNKRGEFHRYPKT